ncbi:glyoxylate reductase : Glyoxylate reductase OS=Planctomyces brasiliensis (strain ATCC 49424 / DSM 5305 / JCM 21570 / NBRC 103401 / IFAM 1448) GN=Plabr_4687 PE=3 SV=1: 2-Hacid_dh: 2-Hacid_dh_C [Gemmataceae bacterium]|nr:glyoxylate reductase : Glyoxylate reductase OS=Planctomyces brasiliensis (strain ATCC 49424 / DSM 5305 / JCM 21570 / NBRC 103401 / IFAM 1448) GN=Plabr_4687 PE=3 SV=1: 2-Hacid_dh: 2-Hacid_dh_C [Gemmataceae bacterium]VTU00263.1 glyoxylate reductase : Glyoxylate reductase OS=Planctomyces brasiliensis (strain ATCC 49424 / DSM 5305 / JCM 21570 / NBRC 103401 / IFAM 1448) GN=Plabr_4687 PE=3 SV=1: 2-Hacid_dh: 2-Hacid_dh_C [Gemmataceae bacterium]
MPRPKVFVARRIPDEGLSAIAAACDVDVWPDRLPPPPDALRDRVRDCDGLVSLLTDRVDAALLDAAPRLKVVSNFAVGFNNVDVPACTQRGVCVGNTPGVLTDATADIAVTLLLNAARRIAESAADAKAGRWLTWEPLGWLGQDLVGRTLGIVGMGRIGFATAKRLHHGWGMKVIYTKRTPSAEAEQQLGARRVELDELLAQSDYVSVHADLNPTTKGLFGAAQFKQMKRTAVFVNTSRGPLVDQPALAEALRSGTIFAAGLDVTDPEPLPPEHELYALPNCVIAPHVASATIDTRNAMARLCANNLLAGVRGEPLPHWVNPDAAAARRK